MEDNVTNRKTLLALINDQLAREEITPHWRVALVMKKLALMGYRIGSEDHV
jgi:hypothetical protein